MVIVLQCIKMSNSVGRNDNFLTKARKLSILPTLLDIFDIRQHYVHILYLFLCQRKTVKPFFAVIGNYYNIL